MKRTIAALILLAFGSAHAQNFGNWSVEAEDNNTLIASTTNDSGGRLFKVCYVDTQNCYWGFQSDTKCEHKLKTHALLNSASGARSVEVQCIVLSDGLTAIVFQDYAALNDVSKTDGQLGIAMALDSGRFKVLRFSMRGSDQAISVVEGGVVTAAKSGTRDLEL